MLKEIRWKKYVRIQYLCRVRLEQHNILLGKFENKKKNLNPEIYTAQHTKIYENRT